MIYDMPTESNEADEAKANKSACGVGCSAQIVGIVVCVSICALIGVFMLYYGSTNVLRSMLKLVPEKPGLDWQIGYACVVTLSIAMLLPIWPPLCMGSGLIFGFIHGAVINFFAIFAAANISFCIGRLLLKEPVRNCLENGDYSRVRRMMLVLEDEENSLKFQILFRFLFIPMFIRNYGPSTLEIPMWKLSVGAIPHSVWISILFASLGATFKDTAELIRDGKEFQFTAIKWQQGLLAGAAMVVAICLGFYAHRMYVAKLEEEDSTSPSRP